MKLLSGLYRWFCHNCFYRILIQIFSFYYYYYYIYIYILIYHLYTMTLISCCYHIIHNQSLAWHCTCTTVLNLLTCLLLVLYRFFSYRIITTSCWFILFSCAIIVDNSSFVYSVDGDMRYIVYRWGFSYMDYPLEVSIS